MTIDNVVTRVPGDAIFEQATEMLRALGHPLRLAIILLLDEQPRTVHELVGLLGAAQPRISQHLGVLRAARLVRGSRDGREVVYRVTDQHVARIARDIVDHAEEADTEKEATP
jgi:ArsR family transcriptional regulator, zinc-responsive transcriptional repressor